MRFLQPSRAVVATDLDGLAADFDFDGISIQLAVASRTSSFNHGFALQYPKFECESSRPSRKKGPLSESLAICLNGFLAMQRGLPELRRRAAVSLAEGSAEMAVAGEAQVYA